MNRYLTTPIYYASGSPHLGHAYTTLVADCYKRYYQLCGEDVLLTSGTDEHGQKIERAAATAGKPVTTFIDERSGEFRDLWGALGIDIDRFERTTSENHKAFALQLWQRLTEAGDIYLDNYEGRYCIDCEQYFTDVDTCPVHRRPLESFSEPSYFFRLGRYQERLIEHIESHPDFIQPESRRNEVLSFLTGNELRDLSISRTSTQWGVPVPGDPGHVFYVWVDALTTYLSALSQNDVLDLDHERIQQWWRDTTHFIGKDILTFHAIYWPAFLLSADLPLPKRLVVNGWLTVEGRKIAKSDPDTVIDPISLTDVVGCDGLRWYFLKGVTLGLDINFQRDSLVQLSNTDLANSFGNLVSRYTRLAEKRLGSTYTHVAELEEADRALLELVDQSGRVLPGLFERGEVSAAARTFIEAVGAINAYLQQQAPWQITDDDRVSAILWTVHHAIADVTVIGTPFIPRTTTLARQALCLAEAQWAQLGSRSNTVQVCDVGPVYQRIAD